MSRIETITLGPGEHRNAEEPLALEPRELFDPCILGMAQRFTSYFLVYDQACVIKAIQNDAGTDYDTALEHFLFNVVGGWVGEGTPAFQLWTTGLVSNADLDVLRAALNQRTEP